MADLAPLVSLLVDGLRRSFGRLRDAAEAPVRGYCLYSDDSAQTAVVVLFASDAPPDPLDDAFWNPHEWEYELECEEMVPVERWLREHYRSMAPEEADYESFRDPLYDAMVAALQGLREEGFFGVGEDQAYVAFSVSEWTETDVQPWVEALNSPAVAAAYARWVQEL